jgi:hypothetical protein
MGKGGSSNHARPPLGYQPLSAEEWSALDRGETIPETDTGLIPSPVKLPPGEGPIKLYLDDLRPTPPGWLGVKTVEEAIAVLQSGRVQEASLDHDLGLEHRSGYELTVWMKQHNVWPGNGVTVHSDNGPGIQNMCEEIESGTRECYRRIGHIFRPR